MDQGFLSARAVWVDGKPGKLKLSGTVLTYTDDATVAVRDSDSEPLNPKIRGVQLDVQEGDGPRKGHPHPWSGEIEMATLDPYDQVQVAGGDEIVVVDIIRDRDTV